MAQVYKKNHGRATIEEKLKAEQYLARAFNAKIALTASGEAGEGEELEDGYDEEAIFDQLVPGFFR